MGVFENPGKLLQAGPGPDLHSRLPSAPIVTESIQALGVSVSMSVQVLYPIVLEMFGYSLFPSVWLHKPMAIDPLRKGLGE